MGLSRSVWWLNFMILKVCSNTDDFLILRNISVGAGDCLGFLLACRFLPRLTKLPYGCVWWIQGEETLGAHPLKSLSTIYPSLTDLLLPPLISWQWGEWKRFDVLCGQAEPQCHLPWQEKCLYNQSLISALPGPVSPWRGPVEVVSTTGGDGDGSYKTPWWQPSSHLLQASKTQVRELFQRRNLNNSVCFLQTPPGLLFANASTVNPLAPTGEQIYLSWQAFLPSALSGLSWTPSLRFYNNIISLLCAATCSMTKPL